MSKKKIDGKGLSGFFQFSKNIFLLPIILSINIPLLLLNIIYRKLMRFVSPRKSKIPKKYPKFDS